MRSLPALMTALVALAACGQPAAPAARPTPEGPHDAIAAGWTAVIDLGQDPEPDRFIQNAGTLEVTQGRNATLWHPDHITKGSYRLTAEVTHLDAGLHPHGAGLVFGGSDVAGESQRYTYFLVRNDRHFLIKTRDGTETADVVPWTEHEAVAREDQEFVTHNRLTVESTPTVTRFLVNDRIVHIAPTKTLPDGDRCGFRLVHDLHVRFGPLALESLDS